MALSGLAAQPLAIAFGSNFVLFHQKMHSARSILLAVILAFMTVTLPETRGQDFETVFADNRGKDPSANLCLGSDGNFYGTTVVGGPNGKGTVFKMTPAYEVTTLVCFNDINGALPKAPLVEGNDGNLYGTTHRGGTGSFGTVFKVTPAGAHTVLVSFNGTNGRNPASGLLLASDGNFYGTTENGGASGNGTIFKMTPAGVLTPLVSFAGPNGSQPSAELVEGSDGNFYGTTGYGGASNYGTVFKMTPGGALTTLVSFNRSTNGAYPLAGLTIGDDGDFYGVTVSGGVEEVGTVFKITSAGVLTTLASFSPEIGGFPSTKLLKWSDGNLYGTTPSRGGGGQGSIFKVTPAGTLTRVVSLLHSISGGFPNAGLTAGNDGSFYGTTTLGGAASSGTIFKGTPDGELTVVTALNYFTNGSYPRAGVVEGPDGNLYGTAEQGGLKGSGTAFKVTLSGELTRLASFNDNGFNGRAPRAGMLAASDGNLYGTAAEDGANGYGTIFRITPAGEVTTLCSLTSAIGSRITAELVEGSDGNFYGTAEFGGENNLGTVFKMTPAGELAVLHSFKGSDGRRPTAALLLGSDGNFYGTTEAGGANDRGTIFKMTPAGVLTTLFSFSLNTGHSPSGELLEWTDGSFYGTTIGGGESGRGTIFKVTPAGFLTTVYSLTLAGGTASRSGLVAGNDGNFYGTAESGGAMNLGTIFKVSPTGEFTRLYSFDGVKAAYPVGKPIFGSDGKLYGTAAQLVVWRLSVPMGPAVTFNPPSSITANSATLSGTVNANGTPANVTFHYGLTPALGTIAGGTPETITGGTFKSVNVTLTGLRAHTTYYYRLTASNQADTNSTAVATFTTANNLPVPANDSYSLSPNDSGSAFLFVLANDSDPDGDPLTITAVTPGSFGTVSTSGSKLTYIPGPAFLGRDSFSYTVSDGFGTATAQVELRASVLFPRVLLSKDSLVPGAGEADSEVANGSRFQKFGVPSMNSAGDLAMIASYASPGSPGELSVVVIDSQARKSKVAARSGQIAGGTEGALFASFKDPLLNEAGDLAILATLSGGDTKGINKEGIWISPASATASTGTQLIARTGAQPPGVPDGAHWKKFTNVALSTSGDAPNSWWLAFTGLMATGPGGIKAGDDMGLWIANPTRTVCVLREKQLLVLPQGEEKRVRTFAALKPLSNALGQGNGVNRVGGVAVQVFFTDGTQTMLQVSWANGSDEGPIISHDFTLPTHPIIGVSEDPVTYGIPTQNNSGSKTSWVGTLSSKVNPHALFERDLTGINFSLLARQGETNTGIEETSFSRFGGVAINDSGSALFSARVRGSGISKANDEGLWRRQWNGEGVSLDLLAREGDQAPGAPEGARWSSFSSIALADGDYGPLFTAELTGSSGMPAAERINSANDRGLWAVDSSGELRLVIREGQEMTAPGSTVPKKLKSFTMLSAVGGSPAQRRSFNDNGRLVYRALFTDNSEAIVTVQLP